MASRITHDFDNLLMVISEQLALARAELSPAHAARAPLEVVEQAAQQARSMTRSLHALTRGTAPSLAPINLSHMLSASTSFLRRCLPDSIELVEDIRIEPPIWIEGNETQLQRVLTNLAMNSREAMSTGGRLVLSLEERPIDLAQQRDRGADPATEARITVCDTGEGMSSETLSRIFEPYLTTRPAGRGTGLGMAIVQDIVTAHGGRVEVHSQPGCGTSVFITIPCCPPGASTGEPSSYGRQNNRVETILVVGRDACVRSIVGEVVGGGL